MTTPENDSAERGIRDALRGGADSLADDARLFFNALGYRSKRTLPVNLPGGEFLEKFKLLPGLKDGINESAFRDYAKNAAVVFQVGNNEIADAAGKGNLFADKFKKGDARSFLFVAVDLKPRKVGYGRGSLARMTRAVNRRFMMPAVVFFRHGDKNKNRTVTLSFAHRRADKRDGARDVLGRVSMLRGISRENPHRGHSQILAELAMPERLHWMRLNEKSEDFDGLLAAWLNTLDTEALNMRFYGELFGWFNRAVAACKFPDGKNEEQVMRMITRLLFIWFVKEKGLAPERLFTEQFAREMLRAHKPDSSDYYQAVLQNLFFGTLNTPPVPAPSRWECCTNSFTFWTAWTRKTKNGNARNWRSPNN